MDHTARKLPSWFLKTSEGRKSSKKFKKGFLKKKDDNEPRIKRTVYCMSPEEFRHFAEELLKDAKRENFETSNQDKNLKSNCDKDYMLTTNINSCINVTQNMGYSQIRREIGTSSNNTMPRHQVGNSSTTILKRNSKTNDTITIISSNNDTISIQSNYNDTMPIQSKHNYTIPAQSKHNYTIPAQSKHNAVIPIQSKHYDTISIQPKDSHSKAILPKISDEIRIHHVSQTGSSFLNTLSDSSIKSSKTDSTISTSFVNEAAIVIPELLLMSENSKSLESNATVPVNTLRESKSLIPDTLPVVRNKINNMYSMNYSIIDDLM